jgi:hypothetical protein
MPALSRIDICNLALGYLPAEQIVSIEENSLGARYCRIFYPQVISDMLEGPNDWSFAIQRVLLAQLATNDRSNEWGYAYALPTNMASALRVLPDFSGLGLAIPIPLPGEPYAETWALSGQFIETPYIIDGTTLYSNIQTATLEYTINDIAGVRVPQLVVTAVSLDLAARICVPVKKDGDRETKLLSLANAAWERAIADDRNRQPEIQGGYISEAIAARRGYLTEQP